MIAATLGLVVKNEEGTIAETIESIMEQDFPRQRMEIIIVDGISQDNTLQILTASLRNGVVKYRIFTTNKGLGRSRQIVVDNAKGEYIIWVDGDMVLPKDFVRRQVAFMEENPKAGIGACYYAYKKRLNWLANVQNMLYVTGQEYFCSIYRVEALRSVGGFDTRIEGACEDVDVITRIGLAGWPIDKNVHMRLYHNSRKTLEGFLGRAQWYGYGHHFLYHKHRHDMQVRARADPLWMETPAFGFVYGLKKCGKAYRLEYRKEFFVIPFLLFLERTFWWIGFIRGHLHGYGHNQIRSDTCASPR